MNTEAYRELKVLEHVSDNANLTQRRLAKELEVALGLVNLLVRRVVKKGYVKLVNVQKNRIRYLITPQGIAEKTRLTYQFLEYSLNLHRRVRQLLKENLARVAAVGGRNVALIGTGEVAELAYLTLKEMDMNLVAIVDDQAAGATFLGQPVPSFETLAHVLFDCGIVGSLNGSVEQLRSRLQAIGVPEEKILLIEQRGPRIQAVVLGRETRDGR